MAGEVAAEAGEAIQGWAASLAAVIWTGMEVRRFVEFICVVLMEVQCNQKKFLSHLSRHFDAWCQIKARCDMQAFICMNEFPRLLLESHHEVCYKHEVFYV
jgi:hypothetical protein